MKLTDEDRILVFLISRAYPPLLQDDPSPQKAVVDWPAVIARAERQALTPLLFDAVKKTGRLREITPTVALDLRRAYLRSANQSEESFRELAALLDAFGEAQISVILLKGSALAVALYDRIAQRPMCDLDLLVPKDSLPEVIKILEGRGFVRYRSLGRGFEQEFMAAMCYRRPKASGLNVEPHWHVLNIPSLADRIPIEWFWRRTQPVDILGRRAQMLSPTAMLLHLSAHYYFHHRGIGLRLLYDIARVLTRCSDRIDGEELTETAQSFGLHWAVQAAVQEAAAVWQVPLPARFSLEAASSAGLPPPETTDVSRYQHHIRDLSAIPGWESRFSYVWRLVFPSREFLRDRYGMRQDRLAAFYYGYRILRGLAGIPGMLSGLMRRLRG